MKKTKAATPIHIVIDPVAWEAHKTQTLTQINDDLESLMTMGMFAGDSEMADIMKAVTTKSREALKG